MPKCEECRGEMTSVRNAAWSARSVLTVSYQIMKSRIRLDFN